LTIHFHCACGQKLKATSDSVGKHFDCPVCGTAVVVPERDEAAPPPARKSVSATVGAGVTAAPPPQAKAEAPASSSAHSDVENRPKQPVAKQKEASRPQPSKAGKNGAPKKKSKAPSDEDLAHEALGLAGDGPSATDTRELAESDTKVIDGSDTKELDKPVERPAEVRNGFIPESEMRLRTDNEILADRVRMMALNQQVHPDALDQDASTADTARDLYKLVRKMKKSDAPAEPVKKPRKKRGGEGEPFDYAGFGAEMLRTVVPGAVGVVVVCLLAYWISSSVMSGGRGLPELGDVSGVVTLDGKPLAGATVTFVPQIEDEEAASHVAPSSGMTDASGRYSLMYVKDVEGAAVGTHIVMISAPKPNGAESLPRRYNSASELGFEVKPGSNDAPFELTSK
jgi:hypothetical protein